jgi:hypothetical protein
VDVVDYLEHVVVGDVVAHQPGEGFQVLEFEQFVFVFVEVVEDGAQALFGFDISNFGHDQLQELLEVDGFVLGPEAADETVDEGVFSAFSQLPEDLVYLFRVDQARMVFVEEVEGVLEALVFFWVELLFPA